MVFLACTVSLTCYHNKRPHVRICSLHTYIPACIRICQSAYVYASLHTYMPACIRICQPAFVYASLHTYMPACIRICQPAFVYASLHSYMPACIRICRLKYEGINHSERANKVNVKRAARMCVNEFTSVLWSHRNDQFGGVDVVLACNQLIMNTCIRTCVNVDLCMNVCLYVRTYVHMLI